MIGDWLVAIALPPLITVGTIAWLRQSRWSDRLADHPNERSLHAWPVPRVGGLGIMAGALPVAFFFASAQGKAILGCAVVLMCISLADDLRSRSIGLRLSAHAFAAAVAILVIVPPLPALGAFAWLAITAAWAAILWMTNLFNFMDGSDGLAGGMSTIGFATLATAAAGAGQTALALESAALAAASAGFLLRNFPPATVFMGDAGSIPLGFLAAALGLHGVQLGAWPPWFPVLVFSPFIADATVTILRRLASGERIWIAHRQHAYQRLVLAGWSRRRLAVIAYVFMSAAAASAMAGLGEGALVRCGIISVWIALYALLYAAIERHAASPAATIVPPTTKERR